MGTNLSRVPILRMEQNGPDVVVGHLEVVSDMWVWLSNLMADGHMVQLGGALLNERLLSVSLFPVPGARSERKIVQLSSSQSDVLGSMLFALCDDGTVWRYEQSQRKWYLLPPLEEANSQ